MPPILLHIYGPFAIHTFGLMIACGLIITLHLLHNDKKLQALICDQELVSILQIGLLLLLVVHGRYHIQAPPLTFELS